MSERLIPNYIDVTIAQGQTDSDWIDLNGKQVVAIVYPATMTSTSIKFRARVDGGSGNIIEQKESTSDYSVSVAASGWQPLSVDVFCGVAEIKLVAGSAEAAARTVRLITRTVS